MPNLHTGDVPNHPISIEEVIERFPTLRQSLLAKYDDCPLSTLFELRYSNGWSTQPQARGTIFHLFAAKCLETMKQTGSRTIPVQLADTILIEATRQTTDSKGDPIDPRDYVRVRLEQLKDLRMAARKFASDNEFNVDRIVSIEERLKAEVEYPHPDGGVVRRTLTGQIDLLLHDGADGAIVVDWKDTWALPPEPTSSKDDTAGLSYHGYFQQRFYAWLVMKTYPHIKSVTLREFYVRRTQARKATVHREQLHEIEAELSVLAQSFDESIAQGAPPYPYGTWPVVDQETGEITGEREVNIGRMGRWQPQPGAHCGFCARSRDCPIEEDTRIEVGAPPATAERARRMAGELQVIEQAKSVIVPSLKAYVELSGEPIPVKSSKGRRALGWVKNKTGSGRTFKLHTPDASDRGPESIDRDFDDKLEGAMREATAEAKRARRPRYGSGRR